MGVIGCAILLYSAMRHALRRMPAEYLALRGRRNPYSHENGECANKGEMELLAYFL